MATRREIPEIFVFNQAGRTCYGAIKGYTALERDIRFGSCSEINMEIPKRFYNLDTYKWEDNPVYNKLVKHNLVYIADDTKYYSFPSRPLASSYSADGYQMNDRIDHHHLTQMTFSQNDGLQNYQLQNETELFTICPVTAYEWKNLSTIDVSDGSLNQKSDWANMFPFGACADFIPVQPYDIISVRSRWDIGNEINLNQESQYADTNIKFRYYNIHFYSTSEAASYLGTVTINVNQANPVYRFSVNSLSSNNYADIKAGMANGGYIRVSIQDNFNPNNHADTNYSSYYKVETENSVTTTTIAWSFPYAGFCEVYSGERRCTYIANGESDDPFEPLLHWFVIDDVEEDVDGIMPIKKIKMYSYEYTLTRRTISLSDDILPLYVPEEIPLIINSNNWVIDRTVTDDQHFYNPQYIRTINGAQYMKRGLLNMVLDELPDWSIGHISSKLMTRYRHFDDVDNADIYTFLMNDVAKAYQCYFVFDCDSKTISAYTQEDIMGNSNIVLNWDNAIKHLTVTHASINRVTALRVHTADDTYGLGLVNPFGGSVIYNFDNCLDQMDFVADSSMNDPLKRNQVLDENDQFVRFRTLREAIQELMAFAAAPETREFYHGHISPFTGGVKISSLADYKLYNKKFVNAHLDLVKAQSKYSETLAEYKSVADKINVFLKNAHPNDYETYLISDHPGQRLNRSISDYSPYYSKALYSELATAIDNYWDAWAEVHRGAGAVDAGKPTARVGAENQFWMYKNLISHVGQKLNMNYRRQQELIAKYPSGDIPVGDDYSVWDEFSILTPAEIKALQPFIIEGDWTNENAVFSETFGADDIVDTLADVMQQANNDFENIYSKDNYDFECDTVNWTAIEEMQPQAERIKVGQSVYLGTEPSKWVVPILLELHIDEKSDDAFKMTFTTDYNRKPLQFRFADLYGTITQTSVTDSTFTFDE